MTNEEFVEKKLSQKFDFFWEKALKKLSHGNEKFFSIRTENYRYYFNKISSRIIGSVLFDIKRYFKVQILFEKYVSLDDMEG